MDDITRRTLFGAGAVGAGLGLAGLSGLMAPRAEATDISVGPLPMPFGADAMGPNRLLVPVFHQVAWIVDDIEAAEQYFLHKVGTTPFVRMRNVRAEDTNGTYLGEPGQWSADLYNGFHGDLNVELIRPLSGESIYSTWLRDRGPSIQHVAYLSSDLAGDRATMVANGFPMVQSFCLPSAQLPLMTINYFDTTKLLGHITELIGLDPNGGAEFLYKAKQL